MATKGDIVNSAYKRLRISGLTTNASPEEVTEALDELEDICAQLESRNICLSYNFNSEPDPSDESGVQSFAVGPLKDILAARLAVYFGKNEALYAKSQKAAISTLAATTAQVRHVQPSRRMPRGSGVTNRYNRWQRFNNPQQQAPISCSTESITYDSTLDYTLDINYFLTLDNGAVETVSSYTLTPRATTLTVVSSDVTDGVLSYRLTCSESARNYEYLDFNVTTDSGRTQHFIINFTTAPNKVAAQ